ncbi:MAG: lysophospholipid transporter LplT [Hylemonella sp.]|uniref:lysophospholipid transporter LplT n=1 Tax=Hylemonella sp. TaxID=2066020 RepID=UPI0039192FD0
MRAQARRLPAGFGWFMAAQFLSALADHALLIVTIAHLQLLGAPLWWAPLLKFSFTLSYVLLAPGIGALADAVCKRRLMMAMNALKLLGALALLSGLHPLAAFALVGLGASAYAPAKYGLLTESVPPAALVAANGWAESAVVLSVLLGTALGGLLVSPLWLQAAAAWLPLPGASSPALNASLVCVLGLYGLAALCHLGIVPSGLRRARRSHAPARLVADFLQANHRLWCDRSGGLSLAVTTVFWGVGALLQFAVLLWAAQQLALGLDQAAWLQGVVALGVVVGAVLVARRLRLRHATAVLVLGLLMGALMASAPLIHDWRVAVPVLLLIGGLGGMLLVPMNALLQHRGHRLLSAGQSIAVQGFNENLSVLLSLGLYAALLALQVPVAAIMVLAGAVLAGFSVWTLMRRRRPPGLQTLSGHLLRRD